MAEETLRFPIEDQDYYEAKVIFQVRREEPTNASIGRARARDPDLVRDDLDDEGRSIMEAVNDFAGGYDVRFGGDTKVTLGQRAMLYLPRSVQINDGVDYERADLGRIGGGAEAAVQNGGSLMNAGARGLQDAASSMTDIFNGALTQDAARYATVRAANMFRNDFSQGVQSALRVATNPNSRQLFREVYFREFTFDFRMVPTSKDEAEMSKKLIKFFRTELYPEDSVRVDINGASIPIAYRFPNTFDIRFKHRNTDIIHRLLPCYLKTISTNYNPTGPGFFEDGNFSEVHLVLTFTESRTLTKRLVRDGGY